MSMQICEIFSSVQGEGQTIGTPAVFIRLTGCNLRCPFCDTKYSYKSNSLFNKEELILRLAAHNSDTFVFTGGEPLLQAKDLFEVIGRIIYLRKKQKRLTPSFIIETNGTILPTTRDSLTSTNTHIHYVASPKFYSDTSYSVDTVINLINIYDAELKLLLFTDTKNVDILYKFLLSIQSKIEPDNVITIQPGLPEGIKDIEVPKYLQQVFELYQDLSAKINFPTRFIVQQHKWIWEMNRRGV